MSGEKIEINYSYTAIAVFIQVFENEAENI